MSEAQHTPGPWIAKHQCPGAQNAKWQVLGAEDHIRCRQIIADLDYVQHSEANARLMAAAPEMLGALEAALKCIIARQSDELADCDRAYMVQTEDEVRASIAKAKGTKS